MRHSWNRAHMWSPFYLCCNIKQLHNKHEGSIAIWVGRTNTYPVCIARLWKQWGKWTAFTATVCPPLFRFPGKQQGMKIGQNHRWKQRDIIDIYDSWDWFETGEHETAHLQIEISPIQEWVGGYWKILPHPCLIHQDVWIVCMHCIKQEDITHTCTNLTTWFRASWSTLHYLTTFHWGTCQVSESGVGLMSFTYMCV
jgi:hypothetical protein